MSTCPFCEGTYEDCLRHATKAHKGQTITLSINPIDTSHSVTMFDTLDRLEKMANVNELEARDIEHRLDWAILAALIRALRHGTTRYEAAT